jgi:hypothetical protein
MRGDHEGGPIWLHARNAGCLSYPFFDPVLTDRAFLAAPRTMLGAFLLGGVIAAVFIFFFGFVGIYGAAAATLRPSWCAAAAAPAKCNHALPCMTEEPPCTCMCGPAQPKRRLS